MSEEERDEAFSELETCTGGRGRNRSRRCGSARHRRYRRGGAIDWGAGGWRISNREAGDPELVCGKREIQIFAARRADGKRAARGRAGGAGLAAIAREF